ncbi:Transcription and mRNA export factor eny2 [Sparganum proliferum]
MSVSQDESAKLRAYINEKLTRTGERERLKDLLKTRLFECGWRDELKAYCKEVIQKKGLENVTADDLVTEITPELIDAIRAFLPEEEEEEEEK